MINRSYNFSLIPLFLVLSACGGGGGGTSTTDPLPLTSSTQTSPTDTGTVTPAGTLSLKWVAPTARSDGDALSLSELDSYTVYFGTSIGDYPDSVPIKDASATSVDIPDLPVGTYYLVITATDSSGQESGPSGVAVREVTLS